MDITIEDVFELVVELENDGDPNVLNSTLHSNFVSVECYEVEALVQELRQCFDLVAERLDTKPYSVVIAVSLAV